MIFVLFVAILNTNKQGLINSYDINSSIDIKNCNSNIIENSNIIQNENVTIVPNEVWILEIPKINLVANISEGTNKNVLDEYIGHFEDTQKFYGNIGLAAHNRGYNVNYFSRIKELEYNDEIYYSYFGKRKIYRVILKTIIQDTDWSYLENTEDNRITLITCVENKPEYRRCIQAIEKVF